jgi:hypothetical protein
VYLTKYGSALSAKGDSGTGSVTISSSGGWVRLHGVWPDGPVAAGWQFTLPSATIYKSIAFQVYAAGPRGIGNEIGLQNFKTCPLTTGPWNAACFDHLAGLGNLTTSATWMSASGSVTNNITGHTARGTAIVAIGTETIYKVRIRLVYGVLQ